MLAAGMMPCSKLGLKRPPSVKAFLCDVAFILGISFALAMNVGRVGITGTNDVNNDKRASLTSMMHNVISRRRD